MDKLFIDKMRTNFLNLHEDARKFTHDLFSELTRTELKSFNYTILDTEMCIHAPCRNLDRDIKISLKNFYIIISIDDGASGLTDVIHKTTSLFDFLDIYDYTFKRLKQDILELIEKWTVELCEQEEELERERQLERRRMEEEAGC